MAPTLLLLVMGGRSAHRGVQDTGVQLRLLLLDPLHLLHGYQVDGHVITRELPGLDFALFQLHLVELLGDGDVVVVGLADTVQ